MTQTIREREAAKEAAYQLYELALDNTQTWRGNAHSKLTAIYDYVNANSAALTEALTRIDELEAENKDLKSSVVAFGAVHAVRHAKEYGLPEGHLEAVHYDILKKSGARMDDFTRRVPSKG